jgi:hypothetical protein
MLAETMLRIGLLLGVGVLGGLPCQAANTESDKPLSEIVTLEKGKSTGCRDPKGPEARLIRSPQQWKELWQAHNSRRSPARPLPEVNFETECVVAVFLGPSGAADRVEIQKVQRKADQPSVLVVEAVKRTPKPGGAVAAVVTHPYHFASIPNGDFKEASLQLTTVVEP